MSSGNTQEVLSSENPGGSAFQVAKYGPLCKVSHLNVFVI